MKGPIQSFRTFSCRHTRKHALEEECTLPSQGPPGSFPGPVQSWSLRVVARGAPGCPPGPFSLPLALSSQEANVALSHVPLFHPSALFCPFSGTFSSKFSIYSKYFRCLLSYFHHLSSHWAFIVLILSHPPLSPPKQRIKETTVSKTCKRSGSSNDFHFIWVPPLNKWRGILF